MKKTLVALAVLAAAGTSFAQVSITGSYAFGYRMSTGVGATATSNGGDQSGLGIDTSTVTFAASEDLGGGLKASASINIDTIARSGVAGGNTSLALSGGFGTLGLSNSRGADYLATYVPGGVAWDGKVTSSLTAGDAISYTSPSFSGFTVSLGHSESAISQAGENASPIGLGVGAAGTPAGAAYQRTNALGLTYTAGKAVVNLGFNQFDQYGALVDLGKNRTSIAGNYDFGVAKVGAGYRVLSMVNGTRSDWSAGVSAPVGALTLGANVVGRTWSDQGVAPAPIGAAYNTNGTRGGQSLTAAYALSKRTAVTASYARWDAVVGAAGSSTETNVLLAHSF